MWKYLFAVALGFIIGALAYSYHIQEYTMPIEEVEQRYITKDDGADLAKKAYFEGRKDQQEEDLELRSAVQEVKNGGN
jgi:hypothetical protein